MSLPCPIVVGDEANIRSTLGDTLFHWVIVFKTTLGNAQMQAIYHSVRFNFDQPNNQTVIHPLTTGT